MSRLIRRILPVSGQVIGYVKPLQPAFRVDMVFGFQLFGITMV